MERTEPVTHADGCHAGTDGGQACADQLCAFRFHFENSFEIR
jgi:hypothetical protein